MAIPKGRLMLYCLFVSAVLQYSILMIYYIVLAEWPSIDEAEIQSWRSRSKSPLLATAVYPVLEITVKYVPND